MTIFPEDKDAVRKNLLRVARIIESGAELERGEARFTLIECSKRPDRKPCRGFLAVVKEPDDRIYAECVVCHKDR